MRDGPQQDERLRPAQGGLDQDERGGPAQGNCGGRPAQEEQTGTQIATEVCGFLTIVVGTFLLHVTRDLDVSMAALQHMAALSGAHHRSGAASELVRARLPVSIPPSVPTPKNGAE